MEVSHSKSFYYGAGHDDVGQFTKMFCVEYVKFLEREREEEEEVRPGVCIVELDDIISDIHHQDVY